MQTRSLGPSNGRKTECENENDWRAKTTGDKRGRVLKRPKAERYIDIPPSTVRTWPVMYLASGLAINATVAAISSHSPNLVNGMRERTWAFMASGNWSV